MLHYTELLPLAPHCQTDYPLLKPPCRERIPDTDDWPVLGGGAVVGKAAPPEFLVVAFGRLSIRPFSRLGDSPGEPAVAYGEVTDHIRLEPSSGRRPVQSRHPTNRNHAVNENAQLLAAIGRLLDFLAEKGVADEILLVGQRIHTWKSEEFRRLVTQTLKALDAVKSNQTEEVSPKPA